MENPMSDPGPWDVERSRTGIDTTGIDANENEEDSDDDPRLPRLSVKDRIRLIGRKALASKPVKENKITGYRQVKGLKVHPHWEYYHKVKKINRLTCFNAVLSLSFAIMSNEARWSKTVVVAPMTPGSSTLLLPANDSAYIEVLKIGVALNVLLVVWGIWRYYSALLELEKIRGSLLPQDTFYSAGYLSSFLLEVFICLIHPPPFVSSQFTVWERHGEYSIHTTDDFLTVCMIPRLYLLFRVFRDFYGLSDENARMYGSLCYVNLDDSFVIFKEIMLQHPIIVVTVFYIFSMGALAYAVCVFERPRDLEYQELRNGAWLIFVTMTTIGYGDAFPQSDLGRFIIAIACALALGILMLLIIGMENVMAPNPKELKVFHILKYKRWKALVKEHAANLIQQFWRCVNQIDRPDEEMVQFKVYTNDVKLAFMVRKFKAVRAMGPQELRDPQQMAEAVYKQTTAILLRISAVRVNLAKRTGYLDQGTRI